MNTKLKPIIAALGLGLAIVSGSATAGVTWHSPLTTFEDDNLDFAYIDAGGVGTGAGVLSMGDVLVSTFEIHSTSGISSGPTPILPDELTGVAAIQVVAIIDKDNDGAIDDVEFAPYAGGMDVILALGGAGPLPGGIGAAGGSAMAAMWLDPTPNYESLGATSCLTGLAECISQTTDGALFQVDGFAGDLDNYWYTLNGAGLAYAAVKAGGPSTPFTFFDFGMDTLFRGAGHVNTDETVSCSPLAIALGQCLGNQLVFVQGQGSVLGGVGLPVGSGILGGAVATRGAFGRSDFDYTKQVPEPSSIALLAVGLLGFGASLGRRRGQSK